MGKSNLRQFPRRTIETTCWIQQGYATVRGRVLDCSAGGLFFAPEIGYDGAFGEVELDDGPVYVTVEDDQGRAFMVGHAEVRWQGHSQAHGVEGMGLQWTAGQAQRLAA